MTIKVEEYCEKMGFFLVTIPAGTKGPTRFGWQKPEQALSDPEKGASVLRAEPHP